MQQATLSAQRRLLHILLKILGQCTFTLRFERRNVFCRCLPDAIFVHRAIIVREHIAHIFDCAPIHLRLGFLHIRIGKLSSKLTDLKQVHADRVHVILIFQKDIKITTEAG